MTRSSSKVPERLRATGGTDFERRLLAAAAQEQPSRELYERMADAIGVTPAAPAATSGGGTNGADAAAPKAAFGSSALLPWISGAAIVAAAAGFLAARKSTSSPPSEHPAASAAHDPEPAPSVPSPVAAPRAPDAIPPAAVSEALPSTPTPPAQRNRTSAKGADLQDQIALVDAARTAISAGSGGHALEILSQYQNKYPAGSFRPEAAALKIEALAELGRTAEARALAERFVAEHGGTPLSDRVARIAGIAPR